METIYTKVRICGNVIEVSHFEKPIIVGQAVKRSGSNYKRLTNWNVDNPKVKNRKDTALKASHRMRQLIFTNFQKSYTFITLTFNEECNLDITSIKECNKAFSNFRKRLNHYLSKHHDGFAFKYIAVTEFQERNGRDAVHYHLVTELPYIKNEVLQKIWGNGMVDIKKHHKPPLEDERIIQYMKKGIYDDRLDGHRKFLPSQNLLQPISLDGDKAETFLSYLEEHEYQMLKSEPYESMQYGTIRNETLKLDNHLIKEILYYEEN
ncbi:hypothetical protein ACEWK1_14495 [Metabacillus sp. YM-086]|uniref:rolling circle replication-associated protein n=1 Tax=Metabacillus sp. YM-086 TaxID=3341729 RepID=UPI003A84555F